MRGRDARQAGAAAVPRCAGQGAVAVARRAGQGAMVEFGGGRWPAVVEITGGEEGNGSYIQNGRPCQHIAILASVCVLSPYCKGCALFCELILSV